MKKIFPYFFGIYSLVLSLILLPLYTEGDQAHYIKAFEGIRDLELFDAFLFFKNTLGSSEPTVFFIYYLTTPYITKDLLISCVNGLFGYVVGILLSRSRATPWVYPLFFLNFYFLVLLFAAERLKFGIIFLIIYFTASKFKKLFAIFSFLSHSQVLILYASVFLSESISKFKASSRKLFSIKNFIYLVIGIAIIYFALGEHIGQKISSYTDTGSAIEKGFPAIIKPLIFVILSLVYCKGNYQNAVLLGLPMLIASYFLGSDRIAIFSYIIFTYFALNYRRGFNVGIIFTSIYFSYQGLGFLQNIIKYSNGFYSG